MCSVAKSCLALCNPMDCSAPGSSVRGIFQARKLECVAISYSRDLPDSAMEAASLLSPALAGGFLTTEPPGKSITVLTGQYLDDILSIIPIPPA